jgi:hypothetical protein
MLAKNSAKNYQKNDVPFNHILGSTILFSAAPYIRTKINYHYHQTGLT